MDSIEQSKRLQEFFGQELSWIFSAGECHFLIQLLAHVVQENPELVTNEKGEKEALNYQSIRTIVLLNEKLNSQLQVHAAEASVSVGVVQGPSEKVQ